MKDTRTAILMAVLLTLLAGYIFQNNIESFFSPSNRNFAKTKPPLVGANEIKIQKIIKNDDGTYVATVDFFYRGDANTAFIQLIAYREEAPNSPVVMSGSWLERGGHTIELEIQRPWAEQGEVVTRRVCAILRLDGKPSVKSQADYLIEWPDSATYYTQREMAKKTTADIYKEAVAAIDSESQDAMKEAKKSLELILLRDPKYVAAYPELARIAMKSNWGPEGLKQAENYLLSGLSIDPANANVKVLLGYVYAHQKRYKESEEKLTEASAIDTHNLWLWTNWGELLSMQKKDDLALAKYMQAIDAERTYDTYDRARIMAYDKVFPILENKKQFDRLNDLHKKKAEEFDKYPYFYAEYGRFRLTHFNDYQAGIALAKKALEKGCDCEEAKYTLGMSYYVAWTKLSGDEKDIAFNQASLFLPNGPNMLYEMARFDETSKIIPELLKKGSSMRAQDNEKYNAMAYALRAGDVDAAQRLAKSGARFDDLVGEEKYPVGLIAFSSQNVKAIKMMKNNGVNFTLLKFNGMNAVDYARKLNNKEILDIVEAGAGYPL